MSNPLELNAGPQVSTKGNIWEKLSSYYGRFGEFVSREGYFCAVEPDEVSEFLAALSQAGITNCTEVSSDHDIRRNIKGDNKYIYMIHATKKQIESLRHNFKSNTPNWLHKIA